ncbi:U3 small nucleolar ribonucleoprotein mpp10 [Cytospora mali]|uniref:U3 small nucleolar ribonucleoprotein protein MPP10 n=1 Tax=Cytospora mali TaxID=578113 RepID=A0A194WCW1_CYTMA|nr:U3 small nucleolar ribonucleoprotein mpp10 [Valsa mali]
MAGASSTTSSLSSTSHTLTHPAPTSSAMAAATTAPREAASMLAFLDSLKPENRYTLLQAPSSIPTASLHWAKHALDAFAGQVSDEQQAARLRDKKRKREGASGDVLKIRKVHVDGFETGQVWQQARRIINSTLDLSQDVLRELEETGKIQSENGLVSGDAEILSENGSEVASYDDGEDSASGSDEEEEKWADAESQQEEEDFSEGEEGEDEDEADFDEDEESDDGEEEEDFDDQPKETFVEDPHGLNDGFFSIDEFNKQTQWLEQQDAKADPYTDAASDDDEVNWHADPMSEPQGKVKGKKAGKDEEEDAIPEESEDEEDGPTFGDMDLNAPEGASDDEAGDLADGLEGDMGLDLTANDVFYNDFFAPPARKVKKGEKPRNSYRPKNAEPDDRDVERAMDDVRRDLFEDLSENSDEEDALSDVSAGDPKSRRSAHERRQAKLAEEIRKMESELVAKRAWTLSGEASASARPMNSLLEEALDFDHAGKPIPVITEEVSEEIEDLVKRRILAGEFDEVPKRRPNADVPADVRRGLVELDDTKAKQSLAEMYEEEHVKNTNPDSYVSAKDEKQRKEEKEIEAMWKDVSAKLDALSSWHYKPKPAAPSLTVVADVATVAMEDAQPTTAQGVSGGQSMIAPQEVYNPNKDTAEKGDVVAKSGLPMARQEMSREDKVRRRRREKERIKKSGGETSKLSKKAQEKKDTMAELKKGGVKVINRKGEVLDMEGNKPQAAKAVTSGSFKL